MLNMNRESLRAVDAWKAAGVSSDPLKSELQQKLSGIENGKPETYRGQLREILTNEIIFGTDLVKAGLADKIEKMFVEELAGPGAVRAVLKKYLN